MPRKCPNCNAFVSAAAGARCEFCGVELPAERRRLESGRGRPAVPVFAILVPILVIVGAIVGGSIYLFRRTQQAVTDSVASVQGAIGDEMRRAVGGAPSGPAGSAGSRPTGPHPAERFGGKGAFDAAAFLEQAVALAREWQKDAALVELAIADVKPDGRADLGASALSGVTYAFRSPATTDGACTHRLVVDTGGLRATTAVSDDGCKQPLVRPPRCTPAEIWERARKAGVPAEGVAQLRYQSVHRDAWWWKEVARSPQPGKKPASHDPDVESAGEWKLDLGPAGRPGQSHTFRDECGT